MGLRDGTALDVRYSDGRREPLGLARWTGPARGADATLVTRARGPVLDIGCGPGRLVAAFAANGLAALGIDVAPAAVGLARTAGGHALQRSVFDDVPLAGRWQCAVLADGNIGIGGDPVRLLRRTGELLAPGGHVLVELALPGTGLRLERIRLETGQDRGSWFPWATVAADAIEAPAASAGLAIVDRWTARDDPADPLSTRWFAVLGAA
jgi:SAM-dependent methyltransferase